MKTNAKAVQKKLTLDAQLASVPMRNRQIKVNEDEDGLNVTVTLSYRPIMRPLVFLFHMRQEKTYRLDGLGRQLFEIVDDNRTLAEIIDWFGALHKLTFFESMAFVQGFLRTLMQRGIIALGVRSEDRSHPV